MRQLRVIVWVLGLLACGGEPSEETEQDQPSAASEAETPTDGEGDEGEGGEEAEASEEAAVDDAQDDELAIDVEEYALEESTTARVAGERRGVAHILIRYRGADRAPSSVTRSKEEAEALARELAQRIEGGADFAAVAAEASEDDANKDHGGEMGTLERGLLPAPLDEALFSMEVGEVRGPIETALGFHLVRRTE